MRHGIRTMAALVALVAGTSALSGCAFVARAGQRGAGLEGNDWSLMGPSMSSDSRWVAFGSDASNLVPGDTNGVGDAFLHDRNSGVTERVSVSTTEVQGDGALDDKPSVSDDADVVAFASFSTNLDPRCPGSIGQIFVRTRSAGTTECITIGFDGFEANANSGEPHVSADGRYVVFDSEASNIVTNDTNGAQDIFVRDLFLNTTERINLQAGGVQSDGGAFWPDISADGRYVVFRTHSADLDPACPVIEDQSYLVDRNTDTIECVSVDNAGRAGNDYSDQPHVSDDGRYVTFFSAAGNLDAVCGPAPGTDAHAYVRDRHNGTTTCESVDAAGLPANSSAHFPELSADGRTLSFLSEATNLDPHCSNPNGLNQMFVRDLDTRVTTCVSVDRTGAAVGGSHGSAPLSRDGRYVAFENTGSLVGDTNTFGDMFVRDVVAGVTTQVSLVSVQPDADVTGPDLSVDGRYLVFSSAASNLVPGDTGGTRDVFRRDQRTGEVIRLSVLTFLGIDFAGNASSRNPSISSNGGAVAFVSDATNLVSNDTNGLADVFVREPGARTISRVSVGVAGAQANGASNEPVISGDGRWVAFESAATNLDPNCTGAMTSVYVRDRLLNTTTCITPLLGGFRQQVEGSGASISADGRYVALRSVAAGVLPCGSPGWIFVWDRVTSLADCVAPGIQADITTSGRFVSFTSSDPGLDPPCTNGVDHVFVGELATNAITCVSTSHTGAAGNGASAVSSISADGRYVAFRTAATNLLHPDNDTNGHTDVVVHDRDLNWTTAANRDLDFNGGNGASDAPAIAPDGVLVAFESAATDLVDGDTLGHTDVFVRAAQAVRIDQGPVRVIPRGTTLVFTLHGLGFQTDSAFSSGAGITLSNLTYLGPDQFRVSVTAAADADVGPRDLNIANLGPAWNTSMITFDQCACITVT